MPLLPHAYSPTPSSRSRSATRRSNSASILSTVDGAAKHALKRRSVPRADFTVQRPI